MALVHTVCHSCACALVNADTSGMDEHTLPLFDAFCEKFGYLTPVGPGNRSGNWDCPACWETVYEHGEEFESLR